MTLRRSELRETAILSAVVGAVALASRIPFIDRSYAVDGDAWNVAYAARHIAETGTYAYSRAPGFPLHELVSAVVWPLGPVVSNSLTAVVSTVGAILFALIVRRLGAPPRTAMLAGVAFAFVPIVLLNSTVTLDYLWALCFVLGAWLAALGGRPVVAGLCLGAAIGCRITSAAMLIPLALLLLPCRSERGPPRQVLTFVLVSLAAGAVFYLPVFLTYGTGFMRFYDVSIDAARRGQLVLYGMTIGTWGVLGSIGIAGAVVAFLVSPRRSMRRAAVSPRPHPRVFGASWVAVGLYVLAYVRIPLEYAYLMPAVPFVLLLLLFLCRPGVFAAAAALVIASPLVFHVSAVYDVAGPGVVFDDARNRRNQIHFLEQAFADINRRSDRPVIVMAGVNRAKFLAMPPRYPSLRFDRDVTVVRDLDPAERMEALDAGHLLYVICQAPVHTYHISQGQILTRHPSGRLDAEIHTYRDRNGEAHPTLASVTSLDEAVTLSLLMPGAEYERRLAEAFLTRQLLIPGYQAPGQGGGGLAPAIVEFQGRRCVAVFDTAERMRSFVTDETTAVRMTGRALLSSVDPELNIAVNLGTPYARVLPSIESQPVPDAFDIDTR